MGVKENLKKMIDRKAQEIEQLEQTIRDARLYLQGLQDAMKALPKESSPSEQQRKLRPGTDVAKVRDILRHSQKPLHIVDILKLLGKVPDTRNKLSLSGSLSGYVREGQIFTRPEPNTFGLAEFANGGGKENNVPVTFGRVS